MKPKSNRKVNILILPKDSKLMLFFLLSFTFIVGAVYESPSQETGDPNTLFFQGNSYYKEGDFAKAVETYEELISFGLEDGRLYYNLGNAYFRLGQKGKAILNYEKASLLIPRDADLQANLSHAVSLIQNGSSIQGPWLSARVGDLHKLLNINEQTILVFSSYILIILFFILAILFKGQSRNLLYPIIVLAVFLSLASLSLAFKIYEREFQRRAVVMAPEAEARFEPAENATVHYTLHEGMTVKVEENREGWYKVARGDGKLGWVRKDSLEIFTGDKN